MHARFARVSSAAFTLTLAVCFAATLFTTSCGVTSGTLGNFTGLAASANTIRVNQQMQITAPENVTGVELA
ncbi:MAG: hypothetical protein WB974_04530, partial [Acidobacteriaceae bacterium]